MTLVAGPKKFRRIRAGAGRGRTWHHAAVPDRAPHRRRRGDTVLRAVAASGVVGFLALEGLVRRRGSASSLASTPDDRGTTPLLVGTYTLAALAAGPTGRRGRRRVALPRAVAVVGLVLEGVGLGMRVWSMRTLGSSYSRTLRVDETQALVDEGPYRVVRHPGYAGSLLVWTGFALTTRRPAAAVAVPALLAGAYRRRIEAEEALLAGALPGYDAYRARTKRLIPGVW